MSDNAYMAAYMLRRYYRRKAQAIALLGGKCKRCGEGREALLQFHHKDRSKKLFVIGKKLASVSEAAFKTEIAKCELRCAECHTSGHHSDFVENTKRLWRTPEYRAKHEQRRRGRVA